MFFNKMIMKSTGDYSDSVARLKNEINSADAIVIGAGAGLSTSANFTYSGERFKEYFSDFEEKYGFHDMYSGGFYPYETLEDYWAYWSKFVYVNRYLRYDNGTYTKLFEIFKDKDYFVLTTNVDHQFQLANFDKHRLFYTQGDYGLFQCSEPCHNNTYDNKEMIFKMVDQQKNMKIPSELIPKCPKCGKPMTMNLRSDNTFVQDDGWYKANIRYNDFIRRHEGMHVLFLELGVGYNTPAIIKYPFWQMTAKNPKAVYACINFGEATHPNEISDRSICINADIREVLEKI